jgi:hypothetical protein
MGNQSSGAATLSSGFISSNIPGASDLLPSNNGRINYGNTAKFYQQATGDLIQKRYNSGQVKPYAGPTARSLFYNAAIYDYNSAKYGQYLFYSIVGNQDPNFYENYYLSERTEYNSKVSEVNAVSGASRNPSAGFLVRQTAANLQAADAASNKIFQFLYGRQDKGSYIVGGSSAPYYWRDFLYCKYYGHIPNNYMITLRRFPSPMRDNLSLPSSIKDTDVYRVQGAGRPVAQAVTWWGGPTNNKLNNIIGFTTGLNWAPKTQADLKNQQGFSQGLFKGALGSLLNGAFGTVAGQEGENAFTGIQNILNIAANATDTGFSESAGANRNFQLRDRAVSQADGPLSDFIWVSVDTIDSTQVRAQGLAGASPTITLNFHYELTSAGEVNTKASLVDILGNLLGLCTNYGNFLTPEVRYNNEFPAFNFPGGDEGLSLFYTNPVKFVKTLIEFAQDPNQSTNGDPVKQALAGTLNSVAKARDLWSSLITQLNTKSLKDLGDSSAASNLALYALTKEFIDTVVFPSSVLTGYPTGEWHLVVGNPCNPIAMIGNLICKNLQIQFGEALGPDDFPTELTATITLEMARPRERGEIESMFNRGQGRLYQSVQPVYSNSQSVGQFGTVNGNVITAPNTDNTNNLSTFWGPENTAAEYAPPGA